MFKETCGVVQNVKVAPGHWVLTLRSRAIAKGAKPGQFVQILCADDSLDPLLPRPFSFLSANGADFSILYHVVGKGTQFLSKKKKGDLLRILGPLGNGFSLKIPESIALVGGGVGIPPLYHLAAMLVRSKAANNKSIHVFLGARNKSLLLCEKDFKKLGVDVVLTTDDGSRGTRGLVTAPLTEFLKKSDATKSRVYTCGPTPMLRAVATLSNHHRVPCEVSVEVPMACGFGACLGCAVKVCEEGCDPRFAIACTEGPVFSASELLWD